MVSKGAGSGDHVCWREEKKARWMVSLSPRSLPIFPLNVVLFPHMQLPLRIFEPRYLEMVKDCVNDDSLFGVACIKHGPEVGGPALPYEVGTVARITGVEEQSPGLLHLKTVGEERFLIRRLIQGKPYLVGQVEPYPVTRVDAPEVGTLADAELTLLAHYLELLSYVGEMSLRVEQVPDNPEAMAYLIGAVLQVPLSVKQGLLAVPDLPTMLHRAAIILRSDIAALTMVLGGEMLRSQRPDTVFSKN